MASHQQEFVQARAHYLEALQFYWLTEFRGTDWAEAWAGMARTLLRQAATMTRGVQLAAIAEHILQQMSAVLWPIFRAPFDETLASARAALGEEAFNTTCAAGQAMTLEQAIADTLREDAGLTRV